MASFRDDDILSFGVIADLHFLEADNGSNYDGTKTRRFRQSFVTLKEANSVFQRECTDFNVQLGDVLDGSAKSRGMHLTCLHEVLQLTSQSPQPWYYLIGNHECYNFTREELKEHFIPSSHESVCTPERLYYDFSPKPGFRVIVLDGYEVSTIRAATPELEDVAEKLIRSKNHNYAAGSNDWFQGIAPELMRYVPFNGTVSDTQLAWLRTQLHQAERNHEKCLVFAHMPVHAPASREQNVMWTCEAVLEVLHSVARGTVLAYINGHDHDGGYAVDSMGINHITPPAPIECAEGEVSYGVVKVKADFTLSVDWTGKAPLNGWPDRLLDEAGPSDHTH